MLAPIKNYLSITKKEWNGLVVLVILIALVLAAPYAYQLFHKDKTINLKAFDKATASLTKPIADSTSATAGDEGYGNEDKVANPAMFSFNPNKLPIAQWQKLGLSAHQAAVIKRYEAKGGKFYSKADVKKIYGITADDYKRLEPFINIPANSNFPKKAAPGTIIELNTADTTKLALLRGIGPSFAVRIVRYRERLGGFYRKEQLKEIYGIDSAKYAEIAPQLRLNPVLVKKININTISFDQLRLFPYLGYKQVNAIIQYRAQHGNYASIADMKNIVLLDEGTLRKIEPYLVFK